MSEKIPVGISACLLGEAVRFDGGHKRLTFAVEELSPWVQFEPVCPEMAIGLTVPRPALRLVKTDGQIALRFSDKREGDLTQAMTDFSDRCVSRFEHLCGYIVCAKSPSCGMERVRVYDAEGKNNRKSGRGIYTSVLMARYPWLPVEEDGRLHDPQIRENFVERIYALHELNGIRQQGLTRGALIDYHSRYKLLLLAHSQPEYRALGRFVALIHEWESLHAFFVEYRQLLMQLMSHHATRRNHTNVLMHVQGYFRKQLNARQRQELTTLIDGYRRATQPLLAPVTLLKHYMAEYPDAYLSGQRYFDPWPEALRLRYGS
ncbi:YbgA family protein [Citrobacter tructae]|uniref:YbgA family protein n=1 Tax=Citrobacter tructae TaxID=2562449 RepID=UPI003F54DD8E